MRTSRVTAAFGFLAITSLCLAQDRPHNFHLVDVKWHVDLKSFEDTGLLIGDIVNTVALRAAPSSVTFDCVKLHVKSVDVDGAQAPFAADGKELKVSLPADTTVGQTVKVHIFYDGRPEAGLYFVPGARAFPAHTNVIYSQGEMVDNRCWLPTWDYPNDKGTSEGIIEVGKGEIAISNGKLLGVQEEPDRRIFHWKMNQPHVTYLISVVAGKFDAGHGFWGKVPVDYYVPQGLHSWGTAAFGGTEKIIDLYSKITGFPYPYAKFCQSAVPDYMFGGMENITAVTQTIGALYPPSTEPLSDATGLVAHELAHQWFGDTVTCQGWSDAWLNEGFATFMPHFWDRACGRLDEYDEGRYGDFQGGLAAHRDQHRPVVWTQYKDALDMFNNFIYPGGSARMFMLMDQLGEARFWKAITAYLNERKFTSVDTPMFFQSMSRASGVDLTPFMKQWFYTPAAPSLTVTEANGDLVIDQTAPYFDLPLDVWTWSGGSWLKKKLQVSGRETTMPLGNQAGKPLLLDPRCFVMANIAEKIPFTPDQLVQLFNAAPNAGEKERIMDTMLDSLSPDQWLTLAESVHSSVVLRHMIGRLGNNAEQYLLELTENGDRRIAQSAVQKLGSLPKSTAIVEKLRSISADDPNEVLRLDALRGLIDLTGDESLVDRAWTTDSYNDGFRQMALGWWQRHKPDVAREKCLDLLAHPSAEPTRVQAIQALGELKDRPGENRVYEALTGVLKESSFGARMSAMTALGQYGNPAAVPLLQPFTKNSLVFFRQESANVIAELQAK